MGGQYRRTLMGDVRYLVGAEAALSELLVRTDLIMTKLTTLEESMASIEERAATVIQFLDADRKALEAKVALVEAERDAAVANDAADAAKMAELQAALDAALADKAQFQLALDTDAAEESALGDVLAPFEAEIPPAPEA
jgi:chaperonin cofactor prefoldin